MYKVVDLFAGAGGLSLGFMQTRKYDIKVAFENSPYMQETYRLNHPGVEVHGDVCAANYDEIKEKYGDIDVVIGGPPCQGFSNANRQKNHAISQNNMLVKQYIRAVLELKPKAFVMENVSMLKSDVHRFYMEESDVETVAKYKIPVKSTYLHLLDQAYVFNGALEIVRHALLDAQQSVAWDMFPPDCKFGLSYYGDIVHTIVDFAGYAIKHIYCAHLLMQEHQELVIENLLNVFFVKQDLIQLIGKNCSISDETALSILRIASLSPDTMGYYANGNARSAPFIQISEHQYLRTIKGLLDEPFDFILYNIRNFFPEAWDKNVNQREAVFRTQLYTVFDDPRFSCVQHPVIIKEKNKTLTDIDAVVIDKKTGEIALFQLKWQDPADYSPFTLKSKRSNYYSAAEKWLEIIEKWLSNSADEDIASKLGVKVKYFDKKKISIFVLGRRRGNYSGNGPYPYECAWSQWYQIMYAASYLRQENEFTISNLYKLIVSTSPFNIKISEKPVTFCYGKYRIKFGGKTFCGKDTR